MTLMFADLPPPGFYWARVHGSDGRWQPVEVYEQHGERRLQLLGELGSAFIDEFGPRLEPPS